MSGKHTPAAIARQAEARRSVRPRELVRHLKAEVAPEPIRDPLALKPLRCLENADVS